MGAKGQYQKSSVYGEKFHRICKPQFPNILVYDKEESLQHQFTTS
jgi:hypothetical protein